jgi:hypothetical protein
MNLSCLLNAFIAVAAMLSVACNRITTTIPQKNDYPGPHVIIYKTKKNYNLLVPVLLTKNKKQLVSYPDVSDIRNLPELPLPDTLTSGYLLDRRGIDGSVAFLNITYVEFAGLRETPVPEVLLRMILDSDPLTEMYDCGPRKQGIDLIGYANSLISNGSLRQQRRLK